MVFDAPEESRNVAEITGRPQAQLAELSSQLSQLAYT